MKWNKKYKEKWGYSAAKDLSINEKECLDKSCFRPHDWNHDGHLVCITNANFGSPGKEAEAKKAQPKNPIKNTKVTILIMGKGD